MIVALLIAFFISFFVNIFGGYLIKQHIFRKELVKDGYYWTWMRGDMSEQMRDYKKKIQEQGKSLLWYYIYYGLGIVTILLFIAVFVSFFNLQVGDRVM